MLEFAVGVRGLVGVSGDRIALVQCHERHNFVLKVFPCCSMADHKMIEDLDKRLRHARKTLVEAKEKNIVLGKGQKWADVEADETTFDRMDLGNTAPGPTNPVVWEQWCGIVQRGHPETLVLSRLSPKLAKELAKRAPGPGAIRKVEWTPLAKKWLQDKKVSCTLTRPRATRPRCLGGSTTRWSMGRSGAKSRADGGGRPRPT